MKSNMTYGTKELAERKGKEEAEKLTNRGYPTTLIEVRQVTKETLVLDGQCPSEMRYVKMQRTGWEAVLS